MARILIVDDKRDLIVLCARFLARHGHQCEGATGVREAIDRWEAQPFDLVLCDLLMPNASGLSLVEHLSTAAPQTVTVVTSGVDDPAVAERAIELGAYGYLVKPIEPNALLINIASALRRRELELQHHQLQEETVDLMARRTAGFIATIDEQRAQTAQLRLAHEESVFVLGALCDGHSAPKSAHPYRVGRYAAVLARLVGIAGSELERLRLAAAFHDVGMSAVPGLDVRHDRALTAAERELLREHTRAGYRALASHDSDLLKLAAVVALTHHERWDGTGYPDGLAANQIPMAGRVVAVADALDSLTVDRLDRPGITFDEAIAHVTAQSGTAFDPRVVQAVTAAASELRRIHRKYADDSAVPTPPPPPPVDGS